MSLVIDAVVYIDAPPELVWEVLTDLPRYGEWNPFVTACESTLRPGDPIDMHVALIGSTPRRQREWMRTNVPERELGYRMRPVPAGALHSLRTHTLSPVNGTRTRYESHFELGGWLQPAVTAVLGTALRRGFESMTAAVGQRAETLRANRDTPPV